MRYVLFILLLSAFSVVAVAQPKTRPTPAKIPSGVPIKPGTTARPIGTTTVLDRGSVSGRTYTNEQFNFEVTFPDAWLIPGDDFEDYMKKQGIDIGLKAPDSLPAGPRAKVNQVIKNILLTAFSSMPGTPDNAVVRLSVEDLAANPQIKDAVDYFDAFRATFASMKAPADFKYSDTQAEKLGSQQFAFLDTSTNAGKKRMYATVRKGYAIMFTISYSKDEDVQTLRRILGEGNFSLK